MVYTYCIEYCIEQFVSNNECPIRYREHLNASDYKGLSAQCYYHWFEPALEKWLDLAKLKIVQRVKKSLDMSTVHQGEMFVKHSTSSNDVVTALCHVSKIKMIKVLNYLTYVYFYFRLYR